VQRKKEMRKRNERSPEFKKKVALLAIKEELTINEIAKKFSVHPVMVSRWKREFLENAHVVFEKKSSLADFGKKEAELHEQIGKLTVANDFLKKKLGI